MTALELGGGDLVLGGFGSGPGGLGGGRGLIVLDGRQLPPGTSSRQAVPENTARDVVNTSSRTSLEEG